MSRVKNLKPAELTFLALLFLVASTGRAYAYLDPGTGSYILQILVAGVLGGLFTIKTFGRQIIDFIRRIFSKKKKQQKDTSQKKNNGKK